MSFMQTTLLSQALDLLIFGMGTVFIFLGLLVIAVNVLSRFISTCFPEPIMPDALATPAKPTASTIQSDIDSTTLAAIQAAIHQHRNKHPRA
jgi:oxaloacetate decarboxylase gamma subunit